MLAVPVADTAQGYQNLETPPDRRPPPDIVVAAIEAKLGSDIVNQAYDTGFPSNANATAAAVSETASDTETQYA